LRAVRDDPAYVLDLAHMPGLVTFPSFHTAMGVIAIYCARGTRWLFWPMLVINLLMIAATPVLGSHYSVLWRGQNGRGRNTRFSRGNQITPWAQPQQRRLSPSQPSTTTLTDPSFRIPSPEPRVPSRAYARIWLTTLPWTSVRRKCRPWYLNVSFV